MLYEIANEPDGNINGTMGWVNHMIDYIHTYEAGKPKQHPVWFAVPWPGGNNADLLARNAETISPNSDVNNDGTKVAISDTDHYFGIGGNADWAWSQFTRGVGRIAYMDCWNNLFLDCSGMGHPIQNFRENLGYIRSYAERINLKKLTPHGELASSGYTLANPIITDAEYLVYLPSGGISTVDRTATTGTLTVEWFNLADGTTTDGGTTMGGAIRNFAPPFYGDAVLFIRNTVPVPAHKIYLPLIR